MASQRPNELYIKEVEKELPEEVEREMAALIALEIEMHRKSEPLKQELRCAKDWSEDSVIASLDNWGYGFIDPKFIKTIFRQNKSSIEEDECWAIVRRFDLDGDEKLTHAEFIKGIEPLEPYSKVLVNENLENRELISYLSTKPVSDTKSMKSLASKKSWSPERATRNADGSSKPDLGKNPLLEKAFERFMKSEEFVGVSPLKYRRPLPPDNFVPVIKAKKPSNEE